MDSKATKFALLRDQVRPRSFLPLAHPSCLIEERGLDVSVEGFLVSYHRAYDSDSNTERCAGVPSFVLSTGWKCTEAATRLSIPRLPRFQTSQLFRTSVADCYVSTSRCVPVQELGQFSEHAPVKQDIEGRTPGRNRSRGSGHMSTSPFMTVIAFPPTRTSVISPASFTAISTSMVLGRSISRPCSTTILATPPSGLTLP
jgi:hypothetical protein